MDNQNFNQQGSYQPQGSGLEEPVSMGEWVITLLVMLVPCVNIVMAFVWAFSKDTKKSKSNFFKVMLIYMAICTVLSLILSSVIAAAVTRLVGSGIY